MTSCNSCKKDLIDITITLNADKVCFEDVWEDQYNNYKFYFNDEKYTTCLECFKQFSIWKYLKNKPDFLKTDHWV